MKCCVSCIWRPALGAVLFPVRRCIWAHVGEQAGCSSSKQQWWWCHSEASQAGRHPVFLRQWTVLVDAPLGKGHYWLCPLVWQMGSKPGLCQLRSTPSTQAHPCQYACQTPPVSSTVRGRMGTGGSCHVNGWRQLDFMYWIVSLSVWYSMYVYLLYVLAQRSVKHFKQLKTTKLALLDIFHLLFYLLGNCYWFCQFYVKF